MSLADVFICIPEAIGPDSKSFEEIRMADYIKAYQATGRPPVSVPQEPADELSRKALGLPPLFKPQSSNLSVSTSTLNPSAQRIVDPAQLPPGQEFRLHAIEAEKYHEISCMKEYEFFSREELRYYAYMAGHKQPSVPVKMDPYVSLAKDEPAPLPGEERLQSICAQPGYERHSAEEYRVAWLLHRRDLTSAELDQLQNPSALPIIATHAPAAPIPLTPLPVPSLPQPVYASAAPSIPKFSFGFK